MNMGEKIKLRREELGLKQWELAEQLGVAGATVQRYESGEIVNLKLETIEKLAKVLQVSPSYLMGWTEKKSTTFAEKYQNEEFSEAELIEIDNFIQYLKSKRR